MAAADTTTALAVPRAAASQPLPPAPAPGPSPVESGQQQMALHSPLAEEAQVEGEAFKKAVESQKHSELLSRIASGEFTVASKR